jgi:hypothetical protein
MTRDPVVEEIHRARQRIWEECGEDADAFFRRLRAAEAKHRGRLVSGTRRAKERTPSSP